MPKIVKLHTAICTAALLTLPGAFPTALNAAPAKATKPAIARQTTGVVLSPEQRKKALAIQNKFQSDVTQLQADKSLDQKGKQAKLQQLVEQRDAAMMQVLTPAQRADFEKRKATIQTQIGQIRKIDLELQKSLSAKQKQQITSVASEAMKQAQAISSDKKLSAADRQKKIGTLREQSEKRTVAFLTPVQRARYTELRRIQRMVLAEERGLFAQ